MVILHYLARVGSEARVDEFVDFMSDKPFKQQKVGFPYEARWVRPGYVYAPDYEDNWVKYDLCSFSNVVAEDFGGVPERYKGVVVSLGEECDPLWLVFGKYHEDIWICQHFTRTFAAGYHKHVTAVEILKSIEPMMDEFQVLDHAGLWESDDLETGYRGFQSALFKLKAFSEVLATASMEYGYAALTSKRFYELHEGRADTANRYTISTFDPHWLRPIPKRVLR